MTAFYNDIDENACATLREAIAQGMIAPGVVDSRPIQEIEPHDLDSLAQVHFFAGAGTWSLALRGAGVSDDRPVWTVSCPRQTFSAAGKGGGFGDSRDLWPHVRRLAGQCRPAILLGGWQPDGEGRQRDGAPTGWQQGDGEPERGFDVERVADAAVGAGQQGESRANERGFQSHVERDAAFRPPATDSDRQTPDWLYCRDGNGIDLETLKTFVSVAMEAAA